METTEYYEILTSDINIKAIAEGSTKAEAFFELYTSDLEETGELEETPQYSSYIDSNPTGVRGAIRIDGNGGDPRGNAERNMIIFINDYSQEPDIDTISQRDVNQIFERGARFIRNSISNDRWRESIGDNGAAWELADMISKLHYAKLINKYTLYILTNKACLLYTSPSPRD